MTSLQQLNTGKIRSDFPILNRLMNGKKLVYLDNAATSQKPSTVIETLNKYYREYNANTHRGIYLLSEEATFAYEEAHKKVAEFINADSEEIIFTKGATESINLIAYSWARKNLREGDEILLTQMEHHSNLVPWQQIAKEVKARLKFIPITENGELEPVERHLTGRTKLVAVTHMSNVLGTINPVKEIIKAAHKAGAVVLVDGAQSVPHFKVDVKDLGCDFLAFSGHKMLGPTGIGVLYGKKELLENMQPFLFGGDMIREVRFEDSTWNDLPWKFEAGTPNIAGGIGLGAAIDYLNLIGIDKMQDYEKELTAYALNKMRELDYIKIYGDADNRGGVISFNLEDIHPHDVAAILDKEGIAIRGGHHCAMPLMKILGIIGCSRVSFYFYNTKEEIDKFIDAIKKARDVFK
jgi:cysteine desulfurase / selenocysteine lyase